jgi:hypothetical protein
MKINVADDEVVMDDGTIYYFNCGIIGTSPVGFIFGGYDSEVTVNPEHKRELAKYMVDLWTKVLNSEVPLT